MRHMAGDDWLPSASSAARSFPLVEVAGIRVAVSIAETSSANSGKRSMPSGTRSRKVETEAAIAASCGKRLAWSPKRSTNTEQKLFASRRLSPSEFSRNASVTVLSQPATLRLVLRLFTYDAPSRRLIYAYRFIQPNNYGVYYKSNQ